MLPIHRHTKTTEVLVLLPEDIPALLEKGDRRLTGPTMPPQGLYLNRVWYDGPAGKMFEEKAEKGEVLL